MLVYFDQKVLLGLQLLKVTENSEYRMKEIIAVYSKTNVHTAFVIKIRSTVF